MLVSERIISLFGQRGFSRRSFALAAGIPPTTFQAAITSSNGMSSRLIARSAEALNISLCELLCPNIFPEADKAAMAAMEKVIGDYFSSAYKIKDTDYIEALVEEELYSIDVETMLKLFDKLNHDGRLIVSTIAKSLSEQQRYVIEEVD